MDVQALGKREGKSQDYGENEGQGEDDVDVDGKSEGKSEDEGGDEDQREDNGVTVNLNMDVEVDCRNF